MPKFRVFYAKKYIGLKKNTTAGCVVGTNISYDVCFAKFFLFVVMNHLAIPICLFRQIWFHFNVEKNFPTIPGYLAMGAIIFHAWEG